MAPMVPRRSTRPPRSSAVILVGHGSHLSPDSSVPVYAQAARIRALGAFDEVVEAFWKEEPCLRDALDVVTSDDVWIVPLFLAEGYFTRQVLPRELGLDGALTIRGSQRIHYCPPVGTHPIMADLILARARAACGLDASARRRAALVVIGHGTDRSESSGDTVYRLVQRLRQRDEFGAVGCGFLDEDPHITSVLNGVDREHVVLVPFFVAEGWHTRTTIPDDLGLEGPVTRRSGATLWYTPPVGTLEEISEAILAICSDAGAPLNTPERAKISASHPSVELARARGSFLESVAQSGSGGFQFLQIRLAADPENSRFELRHQADAALPRDQLATSSNPDFALDVARTTASGVYRPLRSSSDLRRGWGIAVQSEQDFWRALDLIYPGAVLHWYRWMRRDPSVVSFEEWAARQTGIYSDLKDLSASQLPVAVQSCCQSRGCMRVPLWQHSASARDEGDPTRQVPCLEPCTLFATVAREVLKSSPERTACRPA